MPHHLAKYIHNKYSWMLLQLIHGNCMHGKCMHKKYMHRKCMHREIHEYSALHLHSPPSVKEPMPGGKKSSYQEAGTEKKKQKIRWQKVERIEEENNYKHGGLGLTLQNSCHQIQEDKMGKENTAGNHSWVQPWRFSLVEHKPGKKKNHEGQKK